MKILFLNYEYPPLGGGASVATEAILREWATEGVHEVHLVTSGLTSGVNVENLGGKVMLHRLGIKKNPKALHSQSLCDILIYTWRAFWYAHKLVREARNSAQPFQVALAFFGVPCGFLAYGLKKLYKVPYSVALRGSDVPGFSKKYDLFYRFAVPLVRLIWRNASSVIANSSGIRDLAHRASEGQPIVIIENGVDTELFVPQREMRSDGAIVFLSTSRLTERKGIDRLIRAFSLAKKQIEVPLELWLIGDGDQKAALQSLVVAESLQARVKFLGRVAHDNLPGFYQKADVFVLPSKNEGMSNAALEALACGLPLLVSGTGGMQELVRENENGLFIDPENMEQFAGAIMELAQDHEKRLSYGRKSRERALTRSWKHAAHHFIEALEKARLSIPA